jgi:hypothetical protein
MGLILKTELVSGAAPQKRMRSKQESVPKGTDIDRHIFYDVVRGRSDEGIGTSSLSD